MKPIILIALMITCALILVGFQKSNKLQEKMDTTMDKTDKNLSEATFAGGCFWCTESDFEKFDGVVEAISGYVGGETQNPTYQEVSAGGTGHAEAVRVLYDPQRITYTELLDIFWQHVDPTDPGGQFVDRGSQYRPAIFYHDEEQKRLAEESKRKLETSGRFNKSIVTEIVPVSEFYRAEDYHQDYYKKNPIRYKFYRFNSGRDKHIEKMKEKKEKLGKTNGKYRKLSEEELRKLLTPLQYSVTQEDGTEKPFRNEYWNNKKEGIYVDIVSGEPLFSSRDKYDSGTGWPSFTRPLDKDNIIEKNNFQFNEIQAEFYSRGLRINSFKINKWDQNYWDDWIGFGPKIIFGELYPPWRVYGHIWTSFDWNPAKEPYTTHNYS